MPRPSAMYAALTPAQAKHPKETWDWREIHHYMQLKGECFESIYFGVNIDEQEKEKIIQFVRKKLNPHINLYQMRVDADAFRLQPEVIKPLNSDLSIYYTFYKDTQAQRQLATMPIIDYTQIADTIPLIFEVLQHAVPFWHSEQPQVL